MEINAAVFRKVHEPLTIEAVEIDKPWGREVLVRTAATGVCHSDLHVVDGQGRFPLDRPIVLGHEGAGVVEAVGAEVTAVKPGDHIVACLSGFCGNCPQCLSGHPNLCTGGLVTRPEAATPRLSQNGQPLRQFIGISSYAEKMLLHENSLVKIDPELPLDKAALVGCGVLTGVGAALRSSGLEAGQTVAVFGCGGVGLGAVAAAHFRGANTIAIDLDDNKLALAKKAGAQHTINSSRESLHQRLLELSNGLGPDVAIEAIGLPQTFRAAVEEVAFAGRVVYVGYSKEPVAYETRLFVQKELDVLGSRNALPEDFRQVIRMLEDRRFPVDEAVSRIVPIEEAPHMLRVWSDNPASFTKIMVRLD